MTTRAAQEGNNAGVWKELAAIDVQGGGVSGQWSAMNSTGTFR